VPDVRKGEDMSRIYDDENPTSFVRIADALESIAASLEKIANPPVVVMSHDPDCACTHPKGAACRHCSCEPT
jgi:hypothetical protein